MVVANSKAWLLWLLHTLPFLCLIQRILACCRIIAKRTRLFPNLTDLSGRGKSVELEQTTKQTNEQTTRKNTLFTLSRLDMPGDHKSEIGKTPW